MRERRTISDLIKRSLRQGPATKVSPVRLGMIFAMPASAGSLSVHLVSWLPSPGTHPYFPPPSPPLPCPCSDILIREYSLKSYPSNRIRPDAALLSMSASSRKEESLFYYEALPFNRIIKSFKMTGGSAQNQSPFSGVLSLKIASTAILASASIFGFCALTEPSNSTSSLLGSILY